LRPSDDVPAVLDGPGLLGGDQGGDGPEVFVALRPAAGPLGDGPEHLLPAGRGDLCAVAQERGGEPGGLAPGPVALAAQPVRRDAVLLAQLGPQQVGLGLVLLVAGQAQQQHVVVGVVLQLLGQVPAVDAGDGVVTVEPLGGAADHAAVGLAGQVVAVAGV